MKFKQQTSLLSKGWLSGESICPPPMWPGFNSRSRCHMWVEFVVGSRPCSEGFSPGSPVFLPPQKTNIFQIRPGISGRRATLWRCHCKFQFQFPISNFQFSISNFQFPISNFQFPISNFQFPISHFQFPISNFPFPISNFQFPISNFQLPISSSKYEDRSAPISHFTPELV